MRRKPHDSPRPSVAALPSGSLIDFEWPPDFDKFGRHLLAKCPEFELYELYKPGGEQMIETSAEVERALWRSLFRINDSLDPDSWEKKTRDERIAWAIALKKLHNFTVHRYQKGDGGAVPAARELAATLGAAISAALASKDDPETAAQRCGAMFRDAVRALLREADPIPDKRTDKRTPAVAVLIWHAQGMFQYTRKPPKKSELQKRLEAIGYGFPGRTAAVRWRELFRQAGLDKLPE